MTSPAFARCAAPFLSKDCNHPVLAESAGRNALADLNPAASVITAKQDTPARINLIGRTLARVKVPGCVIVVGPKHTPYGANWSISKPAFSAASR